MAEKVVIVDYKMGNLHSVKKKLSRLGVDAVISNKSEDILSANKLILPGVGHFGKAMSKLHDLGLVEALNKAVLENKTPILGICLGMQIMTMKSEEGNSDGLGWINAEVVKFSVKDRLKYKVPHTGWNQISIVKESALMNDIPDKSELYFVHSYHLKMNDNSLALNSTEYEYTFTSAFEKENIYGVQYHPEKSHEVGSFLLRNFINL